MGVVVDDALLKDERDGAHPKSACFVTGKQSLCALE
jgi:hypothetical protein